MLGEISKINLFSHFEINIPSERVQYATKNQQLQKSKMSDNGENVENRENKNQLKRKKIEKVKPKSIKSIEIQNVYVGQQMG